MGERVAKRIVERASGELPSPTGVALTILQLAQRDDSSIKEIARIISADPALSGRLLKFVNSPQRGLSRPVISIEMAVTMLGVGVVHQLALGISVLSSSRTGPCKNFDYLRFWSESLATAFAAKLICEIKQVAQPEEVFVLGLLCQIGVLGLANLHPHEYSEIHPFVSLSDIDDWVAKEQAKFDVDHVDLTQALLEDWGFPTLFLQAVKRFKTTKPQDAEVDSRSEKLTNVMRLALSIGSACVSNSDDQTQQGIKASLLIDLSNELELTSDETENLFNNVVTQWQDWSRLLEVPAPDAPSFSVLVDLVNKREQGNQNKYSQAGLRILVIDDDALLLEIIKQQLTTSGHHVITAESGHEGLQLALEAKPQLVITDWMMPDMDGITLCRALREARIGQLLYIIMLTVHNDEDHMVEALESGADDFLSKPFSERELKARIGAGARLISLQKEVDRERQYNHLYLDTVEVAIVGLDKKGNITLVNRKGSEMLGYSEGKLLTENWFDKFVSPHLVDDSKQEFQDLVNGKKELANYCSETIINCVNDEKTVLWQYSFMFDTDGSINGLLCAGEDITDRILSEKRKSTLEKQLQQSQKIQAIGQLTGGIAHDFNNILASMMGYTYLAQQRFADVDPKLSEYLHQVNQSGERARDLIAQMLAFSRGGHSEPKALSLQPLVAESIKMLKSTIPSSVEVKAQYLADLPQIMIDPVQVHQLIMNLCINARDAMRGSGEMEITLQKVTFSKGEASCSSCETEIEGDFVELQIRDSGEGIDSEIISRIFDPFFSTKDVGRGTGMGLSMVHGIVHEHNGHIMVDSKKAEGAAFRLFFPALDRVIQVSEKQDIKLEKTSIELDQNKSAMKHILIVDDENTVAEFLRELFETRGYKVTIQTDSEQALVLFKTKKQLFDVVITDQTMPKLTGVEMSKAMLNIRPDLPIILCTGYSDVVDEAKASEVGISSYHLKPVDAVNLLNTVSRLVNSNDG